MSWATPDDVVDLTGRAASPESLALAHTLIEIFAHVTPESTDASLVSTRNLRLLTQAVSFQAAWLDTHPDVLDTMDVEGISQDGLNAQYATANAHLLAPLADRCIKRLSWMRAPLRIGRRRQAILDRGNRDSAVHDDRYAWTPMPFGAGPGSTQ